MNYLFIDVETTGLPKNKKLSYKEKDNWPRVVQISFQMCDEEGVFVEEPITAVIKPENYIISEEVSKIHGISHAFAVAEGQDIKSVLDLLEQYIDKADMLIAHNMEFDYNTIASEFYHLDKREPMLNKPKFCTMSNRNVMNFCKLPGKFRDYKYPKLKELYNILFSEEFSNQHNALYDTRATIKCFFELKKRNIIFSEQVLEC